MSRKITVAAFLFLFGCFISASAQKTQESPDTGTCSFSFSTGAGDKSFQYCVTATGNIPQLDAPAGRQLLIGREGYGVCNESPAQAYFDYAVAGESGNWNPPVTLNLTATSVKIARTTSDGVFTLTQTITLDKAAPGVKVVMALKNNTAVTRTVYLIRYADVDSVDYPHNNFDGTANSAFGWGSTAGVNDGFGLVLKNVGIRWGYTNGFGQSIFNPPNPCAFAFNWPGHIVTSADGSMVLAYVDSIAAGKTKTATMTYRGM